MGRGTPSFLPTLVVREAYGTRARDTDWMDGFYPYHEMNTYLGLIAIVLAVVGVRGQACARSLGHVLGLAGGAVAGANAGQVHFSVRLCAHKIPILGSSREPVRFHLWAAMGVAALAAVGVERLVRSPGVSLRPGTDPGRHGSSSFAFRFCSAVYAPVWLEPDRWTQPSNILQFRWLGHELLIAAIRTVVLCAAAWFVARKATLAADALCPTRTLGCSLAALDHCRPAGLALVRRADGRPAVLDRAAGISRRG